MGKFPTIRFGRVRHARFEELEALRRGGKRPSRWARLWAPRQMLLRTGVRTLALDLGPRRQMVLAAAGASCAFVFLGAIGDAIWSRHETAEADHRAERSAETARQARAQTADSHMLVQRLWLELSQTIAERDQAMAAKLADGHVIATQRSNIDRLSADRTDAIDRAVSEHLRWMDERDRLIAEHRAAIEKGEGERARLTVERDRAVADRDAALSTNRDTLLALTVQTRRTVADVEAIVARTGLESGGRFRAARLVYAPRGGPFVPWRISAAAPESLEAPRIDLASSDLVRLQSLHDLLQHLPLTSPVTRAIVSDGFGFRMDPLNGRPALHEGIDFRSSGDPTVYVPAPGKVVFAGWNGEFGYMVEIDHGFGVRTRYAHLSEIKVVVGEEAGFHQPLGTIGATGRVTGAHLHYEIRVDGRVRNPTNFLEASHHVRQADRLDP